MILAVSPFRRPSGNGVNVTATVTVWDEDAGTAKEKLRLVEKVIEGRDFTCIHETVNAIEAWLKIEGVLGGARILSRK